MPQVPMLLLLLSGAMERGHPPEPSDTDLQAAKRGDAAALRRLFTYLYPLVERLTVRHLGPGPDLDDVVQTTMVEIHKSLASFQGRSALSTWAYRIGLNTIRMHLRAKATRNRLLAEATEAPLAVDRSSSFERLEAKERWQVVSALVQAMPESLREIFVLVDMEGLSPAEAAKVLSIRDNAAWVRLHRARKLFWETAANDPYFRHDKDE